ncbi:MAG: hypothetical protein ACOX80_00510 [Methanomassiliicoccaceae archaeon]|jgi:hypothetical protein|nr:hypothetical protein [Methanomassiliicoccaceae archaeon]HOL07642.1 hypothetical protein [Methanomassiliicoccaceae archaeon]HOQ26109.1 hypothetical protein [Methanomassiliicoccaceae archaeon]HPP45182.1 hypothetical protein [Methanomassiliicoccaceae archaeon]HQA20483.1 hypothetical protein [Methanomassiliicoccaceae archaeon]
MDRRAVVMSSAIHDDSVPGIGQANVRRGQAGGTSARTLARIDRSPRY